MENIGLFGYFDIAHYRNGVLLSRTVTPNLIVNSGKTEVAKLIGSGLEGTAFTHLGIGSDNTAPAATQTELLGQITRLSATITNVTTYTTNDTAQFSAAYTAAASVTVQEAGIFNAASGGTMLCRATVGPFGLASGDQLQLTYKVVVSGS